MNIDLLQEFEDSLAPKKVVHLRMHPIARKNKELEEKQQTELDGIEFPDEKPKLAMQPSTAFDAPRIRHVNPQEPIEGITDFGDGFSEVKNVSMEELSKMVADDPERFNLSPAELEKQYMNLPPLDDVDLFFNSGAHKDQVEIAKEQFNEHLESRRNNKPVWDEKYTVKEDMICPVSKEHCDDECCSVGSECNISGGDGVISDSEALSEPKGIFHAVLNAPEVQFNPNKDLSFDEPNYDVMPHGMKEAQQRNGVRDHDLDNYWVEIHEVDGSGIWKTVDNQHEVIWSGANLPMFKSEGGKFYYNIGGKGEVKKGNFQWEDESKEKVVFVPNENGRWYVENKPLDNPKYVIGHDCYDSERGDCSIVVTDISSDDNNYVALYKPVPQREETFLEEVERVSKYYGAGSFIEEEKPTVNEFEIELEEEKPVEQGDFFTPEDVVKQVIENLPYNASNLVINEALNNQANVNTPMLDKALQQSENSPAIFDGEKKDRFFLDEVGQMENNPYPKAYIGVDPGKKGGIVAITQNGIIGKWVIPLLGDNVDGNGIWTILSALKEKYNCTLILEDVHSLFGMSASTNFSMGHTLGILDGIIAVSKIRLIRVSPKTWQKSIWENNDMVYKPIKPEQKKPSVDTKATSINAAYRLYPNADFRATTRSKNPWDGITDACCLSEYGRRNNL